MEAIRVWLVSLNMFSALAGCLYFIFTIRSLKNISGIVFLILLFSFCADSFNYFFIRFIYPNSYIVGNSWYILDFFIGLYLFKRILEGKNTLFYLIGATYAGGAFVSFLFFFEFTESNTFIRLFSNASYIGISLIVFYELLRNPSQKLGRHPIFWLTAAYFIYNSLILLQSVFNNYLVFVLKIGDGYTWIHIIKVLANASKNYVLFYVLILFNRNHIQLPLRAQLK